MSNVRPFIAAAAVLAALSVTAAAERPTRPTAPRGPSPSPMLAPARAQPGAQPVDVSPLQSIAIPPGARWVCRFPGPVLVCVSYLTGAVVSPSNCAGKPKPPCGVVV